MFNGVPCRPATCTKAFGAEYTESLKEFPIYHVVENDDNFSQARNDPVPKFLAIL
jgi:hypothetical protein